ncbi:MAG: T9SS type A sorting domain-containing protein [Ignavibacterium album]|uniref:T9SS type A sorting domain-containing protein n=1 Tax=Ignavibacterium album TaxID=591197 RepID=UPI0026EA6E93|nr:T9SS type A sorting domain-containing protein [Ignavibacterium album]MCX8106784.1 T9SS type A sorting domain-containing protein [Ignavibacterium album]
MNKISVVLFLILTSIYPQSQIQYTDQLKTNSVFTEAPEDIKNTKPFMRQWWFYEQRSYPDDFVPEDAYKNALLEEEQLRLNYEQETIPNFTWVSLGPTPGAYFGYGNISSRIVTGTYDPSNPSVIYIGPANGGVWKSTDSGITWTSLTDNEVSMSMGAIVVDPTNSNIVYAGTGEATYSAVSFYGRGLLKSTNGGATWTNYTSGLPTSTYFSRLKLRPNNPNELLAALGNNGLYRSTNGGQSWSQILSGRVDDIVFSPSGDTAFAVGSGIGIRRSVNGGQTFAAFGSDLPVGTRNHFDLSLTNPSIMYAAVYSSSQVNIYKSINNGINWTSITPTTNFQNLAGQAWYDLYCFVNPKNPNKVYVGTIDIFRSTDGATFTNITNGYNGGYVHVDQHYMFFHPTDENTFIVCNDGGIWRTTNNGSTFSNLNQNLTLTQFYRIAASQFNPGRILGGTQDNGTQQTFSTLNWSATFGGDGGEVCFNPFDSNFILGETQNGGIFRTTNGGTSWSQAQTGLNMSENVAWVAPIIAHPSISGTFYTARTSIYKSTNNGSSWTAISSPVNGTSAIREMAISKSNPNILFASSGAVIFKSTDGGANWINVTTGLPNRTITSINVHPLDENIVLLTFSGFGTDKVYKSTNGGTSWFSIDGPLPDAPVNDLFIYAKDQTIPNTYFVATDIGVFVTIDNGASWTELPSGIPNTVIMHLDYSDSTKMLRAATHGRGVYEAYIDFTIPVELTSFEAFVENQKVNLFWSTATETNNSHFEVERKFKNQEWKKIGEVGGAGTTTIPQTYLFKDDFSFKSYEGKILYRLKQVDFDGSSEYSKVISVDVNFIPEKFAVSQNYPNPFNPNTKISYSIPAGDDNRVVLKVFDLLGKEMTTLVSEIRFAGNYEVEFDAREFPSGIYFYTFEVFDENGVKVHSEVRKMTLLK